MIALDYYGCCHYHLVATETVVAVDYHGYCTCAVALVSLPPNKFVHPLRCYYLMYEIKKYEYGMASNAITFIRNFIKILSVVLMLTQMAKQRVRHDRLRMS